MHTLSDWYVKRAGATMTVYGINEVGEHAKFTGITTVKPGAGCIVAIRDNGMESIRLNH